ncbi:hypothetical protein Q8A67_022099 [Cirrhinus molitorella]|uniref:Uncharacterized protein n=1 Tax=Cirrhinus molitorella TaxID=172907 RepID=A0AA88P828_9TELE|nr:hypothetical protein Q8A67_022099 [Cirrhinus molitorella]
MNRFNLMESNVYLRKQQKKDTVPPVCLNAFIHQRPQTERFHLEIPAEWTVGSEALASASEEGFASKSDRVPFKLQLRATKTGACSD